MELIFIVFKTSFEDLSQPQAFASFLSLPKFGIIGNAKSILNFMSTVNSFLAESESLIKFHQVIKTVWGLRSYDG